LYFNKNQQKLSQKRKQSSGQIFYNFVLRKILAQGGHIVKVILCVPILLIFSVVGSLS